jgi:hypothetical protein
MWTKLKRSTSQKRPRAVGTHLSVLSVGVHFKLPAIIADGFRCGRAPGCISGDPCVSRKSEVDIRTSAAVISRRAGNGLTEPTRFFINSCEHRQSRVPCNRLPEWDGNARKYAYKSIPICLTVRLAATNDAPSGGHGTRQRNTLQVRPQNFSETVIFNWCLFAFANEARFSRP